MSRPYIERHTVLYMLASTVQFSSLKMETERIQAQKDQLQTDLLACRSELEALRVALSHVRNSNKSLTKDKVKLFEFYCF